MGCKPFHTTDQSMRTINNLLTAIFSGTKPKFSPVLSFYYSNIVGDPVMEFYETQSVAVKKYWIKLFKKTLLKHQRIILSPFCRIC